MIDADRPVRELVLGIPGASAVFESHRIDYCCGGARSLRDACAARGAALEGVVAELEGAQRSPAGEGDGVWLERPLTALIEHLRATHHETTRRELARLRAPLEKVLKVHGANHPEMAEVKRLFDALEAELMPHLMKEEEILFPYVAAMDAARERSGPAPRAPFGTVGNPIRMMSMEHDHAGEILARLDAVTSGYTPPADGCTTYRVLYAGLDALAKDLHQHIHLENNVLFPRALAAEAA